MKCFHFTSGGEKRGYDDDDDDGYVSRASKVTWARSLSVASSSVDSVRRSEFESESKDFNDSVEFYGFLSQRRANDLRVFDFFELKEATRGFSRALMIGEGGFGCVYRGVIPVPDSGSGMGTMEIAVKQLNRSGFQGHKEWINEVNVLGVVNHPNLVKLVGYCAEDDERGIQRLLVYELMSNKSLEDHLLARSPSSRLSWFLRLKIAQDAARGLAYLHEEMDFQLIFRDFKASNILLDEEFKAKLSDFGLARQGPTSGSGHVSTSVVGTVGYAAPEYVHTGRLTAKSDVWSFGVVLYELITGRRVLERNLPRGEQKLLEWARPYASDPKRFHMIIDQRLEAEDCVKSARKLASIANKCLTKQPKSRPKMSEVVEMLESLIKEVTPKNIVPENIKEEINEPVDGIQVQSNKEGNLERRRGFDFKQEIVSFRNKSIRKLDWRNWTPNVIKSS